MKPEEARFLRLIVLVALMAIILWQLVIIPLEYLTTESNLIFIKIADSTKTLILMGIVLFFSFITSKLPKLFNYKLMQIFISLLFFLTLIAGNRYNHFYSQLQKYPKIYSKTPTWTIQGGQIKIEGKNFGPAQVAGQVFLNDHQLTIKKWSDSLVVAQQPVLGEFGPAELVVINYFNNQSNPVQHHIKDPAEL